MTLPVTLEAVSVFLLVLARTTSWVTVVPLFAPKGVSPVARLGVAVGLAMFLTPVLAGSTDVPARTADYAVAVGAQVAVGLAMGLLTAIVLSAIEVVGSLADYASGFSYGTMLDPVSGAQSAGFARLTSLTFLALLLVTDGYRSILAGFVMSFRALPPDAVPSLSAGTGAVLGAAMSGVMTTALQIGAPLLGVLFLTEVALALAGRFVPQANALIVGLPVKALVAMATCGTMLALLPGHVPGLVEPAVRISGEVLRR